VYPYLYSYGDLRKPANLLALAADMLATPTIKKWPAKPAPDELVKLSSEQTFAGLYAALHDWYARIEKKSPLGREDAAQQFLGR
jgi:hypothetical protein